MADILLGTTNAVGFVPSGVRFYDALGYINHEGFLPTLQIERTAFPEVGQVNAEGFTPDIGLEVPTTGGVHFTGSAATVTLEYEVVLVQDQGAGSGRFSPFERDEEDILEIVKLFLKKVA